MPVPMSADRPTPEQRARWDSTARHVIAHHGGSLNDLSVLAWAVRALLDALEEAEKELREALERSIERRDRP